MINRLFFSLKKNKKMKKILFSVLLMALIVASCNSKSKSTESSNSEKTEMGNKKYSCPMHPEVQGKLDDKCPKCGMKLNVEVKNK